MKRRLANRRTLVALLVVALAALVGVAVWRAVATGTAGGQRTVTVRRGNLQAAIETTGKLTARRSVAVTSPASGRVQLVAVGVGDTVRRGDVLAVLDDAPARADVAQAERTVAAAESKLAAAQQRAVSDPNALPDAAAAEAGVSDARAALAAARQRLAGTLILAPFDGVVAAVNVAEGVAYGAGGAAFTIVDPADLLVTGDLDEVDRPLVAVGQEADVTVLAFPGTPLTGHITALSDIAQTQGGTTVFTVTIAFARPPTLALLPGMGVELHVVTDERAGVLILPGAAIRRAGDRQYVIVRRAGRDENVEVRTGARSGGDVEVVSGVKEGDVVVLP
ncbi:MAG TPA: efflux RND transporter periplasmic adaptor subunit [Thermomicrobiales bacterium]|nr:efflux RND transporter periplasmic adaptor subunit [Thermomicrobiales bacterium]